MLARKTAFDSLKIALSRSRIAALLGPRQVGKTTLAREFLPAESAGYFDLEDPVSLARLEQPMTALGELRGTVVIDEIQRAPHLFPILRVLADRPGAVAKFLILGSASPALLRQSSESLAGRMEVMELSGFSLAETGVEKLREHWLRGGFPRSFLAASDEDSAAWRRNFTRTFAELDLAAFGVAPVAMMRFWTMLAHYHGQTWNASEVAASLGVAATTVRRYLDLLTGTFIVRQLQPWAENLGKRQVRAPKIYFRDSGIFHTLLGIRTEADLLTHPKLGASWEGYAIEQAIQHHRPDEAYFWATHNGAELDLLLFKNGRRTGIECKRADAPKLTPSMRTAMRDLKLDSLTVLYPGTIAYALAENIRVEPLASLGAIIGTAP